MLNFGLFHSKHVLIYKALPGLSIGNTVAVTTSTLNEAPWLGRCTGVGEGALDVTWMEGGGVRNERIDARMGKGRKSISWKDTIS
jgi:hypothetical protein